MNQVLSQKTSKPPFGVYLATTVVLFFCTLSVADSLGFVPYYVDGTGVPENTVTLSELPELGEEQLVNAPENTVLPVRILAPSIGLDLPIQNIASRDITVLDEALSTGPVRYVDSAELGEEGNMLIFAHSSNVPVVRNQMYKAFNRVPDLKEGEVITVVGKDGAQYLYAVISVRKTDANEAVIDLSAKQGTKLTLSTCDTLTSKSSRFVVEADFVGVVR
jgi:LPXTG-site transpeptidase (sortase) family protein